jgi:hypothetical protein
MHLHPQQLKREFDEVLKFFVDYVDYMEDSKENV